MILSNILIIDRERVNLLKSKDSTISFSIGAPVAKFIEIFDLALIREINGTYMVMQCKNGLLGNGKNIDEDDIMNWKKNQI
jgi:hypothetical protein